MGNTARWKRIGGAAGLVAAGAIAGGVLAGTLTASADEGTTPPGPGYAVSDPSQPQRPDEQLLTGDTKTEVEAAVLAAYPGATIERTETDSGGVYESHIVTADGERIIVLVGADFTVTGTDSGGPGGGGGPRGGSSAEESGAA
ncbi:hypothetical protein DQ238_22085 [Geodermatophilus sp. TF02-6]|uniref:hypothetical protein n=1 Tax=Geodermatophilus sp. TF02-6 TaxID=2250575 RepID=UPI000DE87E2F|nr:hypothetical protein [Geodermatophilus sp. TF02-6]RBY74402.1 hypothetical protein DQ238_22085 [Geodermatophilus sp. TF02-6]